MKLYAIWDTLREGWWDHRVYFRKCDAANHWNAVNERWRRQASWDHVPGGWTAQARFVAREVVLQPVANDA